MFSAICDTSLYLAKVAVKASSLPRRASFAGAVAVATLFDRTAPSSFFCLPALARLQVQRFRRPFTGASAFSAEATLSGALWGEPRRGASFLLQFFLQSFAITAVRTHDEGRIYLNRKDIYAITESPHPRTRFRKGKVHLKKGVNVVVFKIFNEQGNWHGAMGAMRLLDNTAAPV